METAFEQLVYLVTHAVEVLGIFVILVGIGLAALSLTKAPAAGISRYAKVKSTLGRAILLGLELLVAADIINTVAIDPSVQSLAVLAGIVAIRTFLSLSLEVEIEGRWPWRRNDKADERGTG